MHVVHLEVLLCFFLSFFLSFFYAFYDVHLLNEISKSLMHEMVIVRKYTDSVFVHTAQKKCWDAIFPDFLEAEISLA